MSNIHEHQMIEKSPQDVIDELRDRYVTTARDATFEKHLNRRLQVDETGAVKAVPRKYNNAGETRGVMMIDGAGGGKTSLVTRALTRHPALQSDHDAYRPWIGAEVPNPATVKSLGLEILRQSGLKDVSGSSDRWQVWVWVKHRLKLLGTSVLWIDEAQDLLQKGPEVEVMLKTLKSLMQGEHPVIVVLTGVETLGRIAAYDDQVKRRYSKIVLPAVHQASDGARLWTVLRDYCERAGLKPPTDTDLVARLVHASRNRFGLCLENMINAMEIALIDGDTALETAHFAESFAMEESCLPSENVFLAPMWHDIDLTAKPCD